MYLPASVTAALLLTVLSAMFCGSWANTFKGTKGYPLAAALSVTRLGAQRSMPDQPELDSFLAVRAAGAGQ